MADPVITDQTTDTRGVAQIEVDRELCIGASSCVALAPEAFELDAENKAVVKASWSSLTDQQLIDAAKSCPVAAIILYGKDGKKIYPEA